MKKLIIMGLVLSASTVFAQDVTSEKSNVTLKDLRVTENDSKRIMDEIDQKRPAPEPAKSTYQQFEDKVKKEKDADGFGPIIEKDKRGVKYKKSY